MGNERGKDRMRRSQLPEDVGEWIGAEAVVGPQARQYIRRKGFSGQNFAMLFLSLTFFGGLALGGVLSSLFRSRKRS